MIGNRAIVNALVSYSKTLGVFEKVNGHEPKNAPSKGVSTAIWVQRIEPAKSGLASTSCRFVVNQRLYINMLKDPQDAIDEELMDVVDLLFVKYSENFKLQLDNVRSIDLLGSAGQGLSAEAGYMSQDGKMFRVMTLTIPVIVNDAWEQEA